MNPWLLYIVSVIYGGVAVQYILDERYGMALAFLAYGLANLGFALDGRGV